MLTYALLKNHAGILLMGDYETLKSLNEVVHDVNERSPLVQDKEGWFLALAYDLRMAYNGRRRTIDSPDECPEIGLRFGVEILWPVILWQCRVLRSSLAYIDTTEHMQAHTYALEAVIKAALREDFGGVIGANVVAKWERIDPGHENVEKMLDSRGAVFCSWTKAQRRAGIIGLVASLDPMYPELYPIWARNGVTNLVSPEEYERYQGTEWADPKW